MTGLEVLLRGVIFGLGAAVPIGPVNVEIARRSLRRGWAHGFFLGLGAVSVDVVYACVSMVGTGAAGNVVQGPWVFWPLAIAGILLLGYLGVGCIREAFKAWQSGWQISDVEGAAPRLAKVYATGLAMTAINPMTLAVWFVVLPVQAMAQGVAQGQLPFIAAGVFAGTMTWVVCFSSLMAFLGRFRKAWWIAVADLLGGAVLLGFAIWGTVKCILRMMGK